MFNRLKIRGKILVLVLGINVLVQIIVFGIYYRFTKRIVVGEIQQKAMEKVGLVATSIEGYFLEKARIPWTFSQDPNIKRWLEFEVRRGVDHSKDPVYRDMIHYFKAIVASDPEIRSAFLASEKSQEYYESGERVLPSDYFVGKREWYKKIVQLGKPLYDIDPDYLDKVAYLNYRVPIYNPGGKLLGAAGIDITLENLSSFMTRLEAFETAVPFLIARDGTILYHPNKDYMFSKTLREYEDKENGFVHLNRVADRIEKNEPGIETAVFEGREQFFIINPIPKIGWTLVLGVATEEINAPLTNLTQNTLFIIPVSLGLLVFAILWVTGKISKPLVRLVTRMRNIAEGEGDLVSRIHIDSGDEIGDLARWFNLFVEKMHAIISQVKKNTDQLAVSTGEISSAAVELAAATEEQTTQAGEVATSVQEVAASVVLNSQNANQTALISQKASQRANRGSDSMQEIRQRMSEIVDSVTEAEGIIGSLFKRLDAIGDIVYVIDDISAQTKVLAINAAIEAANAGEQGKGFAVVANEVRSLVARTGEATKEIGETIRTIQDDSHKAFQAMSRVNQVVERGKDVVQESEGVFREIVQAVSDAMTMIQQIAMASDEQSAGAEEISKSVTSIGQVTKQSAFGVEQMAAAARHVNAQTEELRHLVRQFILEADNVRMQA